MTLATDHEKSSSAVRLDHGKTWTQAEATALYEMPFNDLLFRAQTMHRENFDPNRVQLSRLLTSRPGAVQRIAATAASPCTTSSA